MPLIEIPEEFLPEHTACQPVALDELIAVQARQALAIWCVVRGERKFPSREDLKPRDIAAIMPYMAMATVIDGGADFENGFVGDAVVRVHDVPIKHRRFSDLAKDMPMVIAGLLPLYRKVVETGEPLAYRGLTGHDASHVIYTDVEGVLLPLGRDDSAVEQVLYAGSCELKALRRN